MKVSLITATYNSAETICDTVSSVVSQEYDNIEYIVVDGNSNDGTLSAIRNIYQKDIKIISEDDNGIYDALNKGIKKATGDIIGFLHSDDIFSDATCISRIVKAFSSEGCDAVYSDLDYVSKVNCKKVIRRWRSRDYSLKCIERGWMPPHPTFFMKNHLYQKFGGFDSSLKISGDYEFLVRLLYKEKIDAFYINFVITKMRLGGESNRSISNIIQKLKEDVSVMRRYDLNPFKALVGKNISKLVQFM